MTFGLKLAGFYAEFRRNRARLEAARAEIATCAISGAVGTASPTSTRRWKRTWHLQKMGLTPEPVSTQVIPRDRHAHVLRSWALSRRRSSGWQAEIRHLQRTEVREAEEHFSPGQKGSS